MPSLGYEDLHEVIRVDDDDAIATAADSQARKRSSPAYRVSITWADLQTQIARRTRQLIVSIFATRERYLSNPVTRSNGSRFLGRGGGRRRLSDAD